MSEGAAPVRTAALDASAGQATHRDIGRRLAITLGPILVSLVLAGCVLLAVGVDPLAYYGFVVERGLLSPLGLQQTLTRMEEQLVALAASVTTPGSRSCPASTTRPPTR